MRHGLRAVLPRHRLVRSLCLALAAVLVLGLAAQMGLAGAARASASATSPPKTSSAGVSTAQTGSTGVQSAAQLSAEFGKDWWKSKDFIITSSGDAQGMHYYIAREDEGYYWRPLATILPAGADAGTWSGNFCVTGDNRYVLATVAPTLSENYSDLENHGALAYVIDIATGKVRPLIAGVAVYYDVPGCGTGDTGVLTSFPGDDQSRTDLVTVNLAAARLVRQQMKAGQFTSAVPVAGGIDAYNAGTIETVTTSGAVRKLARVTGTAYDLMPSAGGGLEYVTTTGGNTASAWWLAGGKTHQVGTGNRESLLLRPGAAGRNIVTGTTEGNTTMRASAEAAGLVSASGPAQAPPVGLAASASRQGSVTETLQSTGQGTARLTPVPVLTSTATGKVVQRSLPTTAAPATTSLPVALDGAVPEASAARQAGTMTSATNTTSPVCAVPRLALNRQVLQPNRQQVEWAADEAVLGDLTVQRPANYHDMGLAAYTPDGDIPAPSLAGGGNIPPQILLGVLAQESNFWQASWHALPGVAGDPMVADYYGAPANNIDTINYANADCGYGVGQITTGMHFSDQSYWGSVSETGDSGADMQAKIAVDYTENIAAAVYALSQKWNQLATYSPAILANGGSAQYTTNWYMALWAYNSGINPQASTGNTTGCTPGPSCTDPQGYWGLGWANNPENPDWNPSRAPFLKKSYGDAATPQDWPYQEKVLGWSTVPLLDYTGTPSYTGTTIYPADAPLYTFCTSANACNVALSQPCTLSNLHCWWHQPVTWDTCSANPNSGACAVGSYTYPANDESEPATNDPHPADCDSTLPSNAVIVDDEPADENVVGCNPGSENWSSQGNFTLTQGTDSSGTPISVVDTHQLGAGFGGHLYFTHNILSSDTEHLVTGTWTDSSLPTGAYHVLVHIPDTGGTTNSANYQVTASSGSVFNTVVNQYQQQNQWVGIGYYGLGPNVQVQLTNVTQDQGIEAHDVAYDAIAFVPAAGTVVNHQFDAVSLFDWNQDLDTPTPSLLNTPARNMQTLYQWGMDYSYEGPDWNGNGSTIYGVTAYPDCTSLSNITSSCVPPDVYNSATNWFDQVATAGPAPSTSTTPVMTEAQWLGFSNTTPGPTTLASNPYAQDPSYKIKTHLDVSFVENNGTIVPGSQQITATVRTGTTAMPDFVSSFMKAVQTDYGIAAPDLNYDEDDANTFTGDATPVTPLSNGQLPGRALVWHADTPTLTNSNTCVAGRVISGGEIGWRPVVAQTSVGGSVEAWVSALKNDTSVNPAVAAEAGEIYNFFFNGTYALGSLFGQAPPIWQEMHLQFCANGSISSTAEVENAADTPALTLVDQSLMPDLYLYYDGNLVSQTGSAVSAPVQKGDFSDFSNASPTTGDNGWGGCSTGSIGNAGNPWNMQTGALADAIPLTGNYCDNTGEDFGSMYGGG